MLDYSLGNRIVFDSRTHSHQGKKELGKTTALFDAEADLTVDLV